MTEARLLRRIWEQREREVQRERAQLDARKAHDKKRCKCRCDAYKFPHRPGGGLCRYPDPPAQRWQDAQAAEIAARVEQFKVRWGEPSVEQMADLTALTTKPYRPYEARYTGLRRQIARVNNLHPIKDRALIAGLMPTVLASAKKLKRQSAKVRYRRMQITDTGGVTAWLQRYGVSI